MLFDHSRARPRDRCDRGQVRRLLGLREPEAKYAVERAGGEVWKSPGPDLDVGSSVTDTHYTEIALDAMPDLEFAQVFVNDGPLLEVCRSVRAMIDAL